MADNSERPWWSYSLEEQKVMIEDAVDAFLAQPKELTDRQKLLLRDAIGHTYRGLFSIAAHDLYLLGLPESAWSDAARVDPVMVEGITRGALKRVLCALREAPVQTPAVFR